MNWWFGEFWQINPVFAGSWALWVIVSITLHELAHGWMAMRCGDDVPLRSGHMTWNPLVHIPFPWAWIMFGVFGITWGLMPVQPANFRGRYDDAKVAFAGPAMNLLLCVVCVVLDVLWLTYMTSTGDPYHQNVHTILWCGAMINLMLFVFNLIPIPPLDGSRILSDFVPSFRRVWEGPQGGIIGLVAFMALFWFGGRYVFGAAISGGSLAVQVGLLVTGGEWRNPIR